MIVEGIRIEILDADDNPLPEYKDPLYFPKSDFLYQTFLELPPPDKSQAFGFRYAVEKDSYLRYFANGKSLSVRFYLEDTPDLTLQNATGQIVSMKYPDNVYSARKGHVVAYDGSTGESFCSTLAFCPLETTDERVSVNQDYIPSGFIEIRIWGYKERCAWDPTMDLLEDFSTDTRPDIVVPEKNVKDLGISATVGTAEVSKKKLQPLVHGDYDSVYPFLRLRFHYRDRGTLIARGLIQDTSWPNALDSYRIKEEGYEYKSNGITSPALARGRPGRFEGYAQRKRADGLQTNKRPFEGSHPKRNCTSTGLDDDDDIEIIIPPPKKRIVIDLTSD